MPNDRIVPGAPDPRHNPRLAARAAKIYLNQISKSMGGTIEPTWLYMGHNLGIGAAPMIFREARAGNCRPLVDLYKTRPNWKPWPIVATQNRYSQTSTTCNIRDQIAGKFIPYIKKATPAKTEAVDQKASPTAVPTAPQSPPAAGRTAGSAIANISRRCAPPPSTTPATEASTPAAPKTCGNNQDPAAPADKK